MAGPDFTRQPVTSLAPDVVLRPHHEDHRVRVAREKRQRMRTQLLRSVTAVCSEEAINSAKVIDDVIQHAKVSRGTFYKHFASMEDAVAVAAAELVQEMTVGIYPIYDVLEDARERVSTGFQLFLKRAELSHGWGGFVAHLGKVEPGNRMILDIEADVRLGVEQGHFNLSDARLGVDLLVGITVQAVLRIAHGDAPAGYGEAGAALVLRAFGQSPTDAVAIARAMATRLEAEGPRLLDWWS